MCEKKCVISLKRQRMFDEEDPMLGNSLLREINNSFSSQAKSSAIDISDSESEEEARENPSTTQLGDGEFEPVPGTSNENECDQQLNPGPAQYEDITEPLATSTPFHEEDDDEIVPAAAASICEELEDVWDGENLEVVKSEVRETTKIIKDFKSTFLKDVQKIIKKKSKVYLPKLTERRSKISKTIYKLNKQKKQIDILLQSLHRQKRDMDTQIENFEYFIENFPNLAG